MFADDEDELDETDKRAIKLLDDLACSIVDGDASVDKIDVKNELAETPMCAGDEYPFIEHFVVGKTLTIRYNN